MSSPCCTGNCDQVLAQAEERGLRLEEAKQPGNLLALSVVIKPLRQVGQ
jgi:hypothetical protein